MFHFIILHNHNPQPLDHQRNGGSAWESEPTSQFITGALVLKDRLVTNCHHNIDRLEATKTIVLWQTFETLAQISPIKSFVISKPECPWRSFFQFP
jgi:hypothetical protein